MEELERSEVGLGKEEVMEERAEVMEQERQEGGEVGLGGVVVRGDPLLPLLKGVDQHF